jgi:HEAT repeat protein
MKQCFNTLVIGSRRTLLQGVSAMSLILAGASAHGAMPNNGIGNPMLHIPNLPVLHVQMTYNPALIKLWHEALQQNIPEVLSKTCTAIDTAISKKVPDLQTLLPDLEHLAASKTTPMSVRISVVKTLAALANRHSEPLLVKLDSSSHAGLALELDALLARWKSPSMQTIWLKRLQPGAAPLQLQISAARSVGTARISAANAILRKIAVQNRQHLALRLAAADSLAMLHRPGLTTLAARMLKAQGTALPQRLIACKIISAANSAAQRKMLLRFAVDPNSAVAAIAWQSLLTHDVTVLQNIAPHMSVNPDPTIRMLVVRAWRHIGGVKSIQGLAILLNDPRRPIRWYARDALIHLASHASWHAVVIHDCRAVIRGSHPLAIRQACLVLGKLDDKASAGQFVALLHSPSQPVRLGAIVALRRVAVRSTLPDVLTFAEKTAKNSQNSTAKLKAPPAAGAHADMAGVELRSAADNLQLSQAFQFFGLMRYRPALPVMIACIPKYAPYGVEARQAAIWAIGMIDNGQNHPRLAKELAGRLDDMEMPIPEFEQVREMSALTLGRIKATKRLTDLKASFTTDDIGPLSLACRWAIGRLTGKLPPPPHASSTFQTGFLVPLGNK